MGFKSQASPNPFHNPSYLLLEPFLCGFACVRIIIPVKGPLLVPFQTSDTWLHIIFKQSLVWRRIHCWNSDRKLLKKQNNSKPPWFIIIARFFVWKSLVCLQLLKTPVQVVCTEFYLLDASGSPSSCNAGNHLLSLFLTSCITIDLYSWLTLCTIKILIARCFGHLKSRNSS